MEKVRVRKIFGKWKDSGRQEYVAVELDVDMYHNRGVKYLHAGKYQKAIKMFRKEIECEPSSDIGYHFLGRTLQAMGRKEEAKKNYEVALKQAEEMKQKYPGDVDEEVFEEIKKDLKSLGVPEDSNSI